MCFFLQLFHDDKCFFSAGDSVRASPYKLLRVGVHVNVEYPSVAPFKEQVDGAYTNSVNLMNLRVSVKCLKASK